MLAVGILSCTASTDDEKTSSTPVGTTDTEGAYTSLISKTAPYPSAYESETAHGGRIERIDYNTSDYAEGTGRERTNTAYVYLPYGYDSNVNTRYNVLYLVHGHYGNAATTFEAEGGLLRRVLDHMVEHGDMAPTIVVSPSYNYGEPTASYVDADPYCKALPTELVRDLIPIVETHYCTYLVSPDADGIAASREHRAIGGFSMGGVTTWYALDETFDAFKYYLPISGDCWSLGAFAGMNRPAQTAQHLATSISRSAYANDFYIWAASGTSDSAYSETMLQVRGMAQLTDIFGLSHLSFHEKDGARHEYRPIPEYVYNALPFFFPPQRGTGISYAAAAEENRRHMTYNVAGIPTADGASSVVVKDGRKYIKR